MKSNADAVPNNDSSIKVHDVDQIQRNRENKPYRVYRDKLSLVIEAMRECRQFCYLTFDESRTLVDAESDRRFVS